MKKTFIALLVLAGVGYAAPPKEGDWTWVGEEAPPGTFVFKGQTLEITKNTNGKKLCYTGTALPMENGSGLSITFQFNTETFLSDKNEPGKSGTGMSIILLNEQNGNFHAFTVINQMNTYQDYHAEGPLNIYDSYSNNIYDRCFNPTSENGLTRITINYTVRDNKLYWNYGIDGIIDTVSEEIDTGLTLDPTLVWKPTFGVSNTAFNVYTVTDVTLIPAPEPTTAALSLLALAGLAARRRR